MSVELLPGEAGVDGLVDAAPFAGGVEDRAVGRIHHDAGDAAAGGAVGIDRVVIGVVGTDVDDLGDLGVERSADQESRDQEEARESGQGTARRPGHSATSSNGQTGASKRPLAATLQVPPSSVSSRQ